VDLGRDKSVCGILSRLAGASPSDGPVKASGTWGSFAPMLASHISKTLKRPILYVSSHIDDADNVCGDLQVFCSKNIDTFGVIESQTNIADATDTINANRLRISLAMQDENRDQHPIIVAPVQALSQPVASAEALRQSGLKLSRNQTIEPELIIGWLCDSGFERVDSIDVSGQFAKRGGIIDIFAPVTTQMLNAGNSQPLRIEFFGDCIESIRKINLDTQRSGDEIEQVCIVATTVNVKSSDETDLFVNMLPTDTVVILEEPLEIQEVSEVFLSRVDDPHGLFSWQKIYKAIGKFTSLEISRFGSGEDVINLDVSSSQQFEHKKTVMWKSKKAALEELTSAAEEKYVLLYCESAAEAERIGEIVRDICGGPLPDKFSMPLGFITQGFIINSLDTIVVSHHEIFGQYALRRRIRTIRSTSPVDSLIDLQKGDYVVHISYGIGKFLGVRTMTKGEATSEYLSIEYADKVTIHVPASNISLVHKYIGSLPKRPKLSKIGTKKWENQKQRAAKGVAELAADMLQIQAKREKLGGFAFGTDTLWQKEFEESFIYQETPDQLTVAGEIKNDMITARPMDRLLCGDVGYGKTELAMRAAFKAVEGGKQVAVLVPTTILCVQHSRTFAQRFADFPITIETLNRFKTAKEIADVISRTKAGRVDILIGTHRLLSDDVGFKDPGLLIIDEEQRFGVEHKEKLKRLRFNVDVLTMTATPIPRTLHISLLGLRDISSLSTPPLDRRSIVTRVCTPDKATIRKAIMHELNRDGQIFFVHNRVQSIERTAERLRVTVNDPKVRIDIAHGQMHKHELENAMIKFVRGKTDILVCSTIIESGLDIPNANTMIIDNADRFGLAQLHQLRGRVGRYKHRAFAYMLLPAERSVTPTAAKRLKAIEEYSQLGAGFRIALRDLEIRGAGNILGSEQSGHINTVGYEMYCRLLAEAVKRLNNEPIEKPVTMTINIGSASASYIPKSYIASDRQRMDVYRRIAIAKNEKDLNQLREELNDLFGKIPTQVDDLIDITELRIAAANFGIRSITTLDLDLIFSFDDGASAKDLFKRAPGRVSVPDAKTVHLRLEKNYFEPQTLKSVLRKLLKPPI